MDGSRGGGTCAVVQLRRTLCVLLLLATLPGCASMRFAYLSSYSRTLQPVCLEQFNGSYIAGFFSPGDDKLGNGLYLLEPYRPGAIPVIFVHGLVSDPSTWVNAHQSLRSDPLIAQRYQFWAFRYETGPSYLGAAADLREELHRVRSTLDPNGTDEALSNVVLVGHSMGGIISKLQATHSETHLWSTVSNRSPLEVHADPSTRDRVTRLFFFNPQPGITRIVYIATPHHGSLVATNRLGTLGQRLVMFPRTMVRGYSRFQEQNLDIFPNLPDRPPTSVEQLRPSSPILHATTRLRFADGITQHTILGIGERTSSWRCFDGDGYVATWSAHWPHAVSEYPIYEAHTEIHKHHEAAAELRRILYEHVQLQPQQQASRPPTTSTLVAPSRAHRTEVSRRLPTTGL